MKVLYVGLARSIWLFDLNLLNPKGLSLQPVIKGLAERYRFASAPKDQLDLSEQKPLSFKAGLFKDSEGIPVSISFTIYADGFVAETQASTDVSTEFLVEVRDWLAEEFGLLLPSTMRKVYITQVDVECDLPLDRLHPGLNQLTKFIDSRVKTPDGQPRRHEVSGLGIWSEDFGKPNAFAAFKFERKISAPFSANHYFSQSPLETKDHLELLDALESLLK